MTVHVAFILSILLLIIALSSSSGFVSQPGFGHQQKQKQQQQQQQQQKASSLTVGRAQEFGQRRAERLCATEDDTEEDTEDDTEVDTEDEQPPVQTLGGGTSMIFAMARRMLVWEEAKTKPPPRWHPHAGISDVNPSFRTKSPIMSNQGYAGAIWRNVRKRNKPSLWRHALRTYDRMKNVDRTILKIEQTTVHHEGALLACAKLGLWKEALQIYEAVGGLDPKGVTDNMILSLVKACVLGSKKILPDEHSLEERRVPLDEALRVLATIDQNHDIPLVSRHLNPLAAAYQSIGLLQEAESVIQQNLKDRTTGPEAEHGIDPFNVNDICTKDKASYALLVRGSVSQRDWKGAVAALQDMTESGLYPNARHLNSWYEVSERKTRERKTRSWKKKRNEYWLESVQ